MNIVEKFREAARSRPAKPAVISNKTNSFRTITFAELDDISAKLATLLKGRGLGSDDIALVFQPMDIELYIVLLAVLRLGAVPMFVEPNAGVRVIEASCEVVTPSCFIGIPRAHLMRLVIPALRAIGNNISTGHWVPGAIRMQSARSCSPMVEIEPRSDEDPALITFTSGSTGAPKGVTRSQGFLLRQHSAIVNATSLRAGETDLISLPVFLFSNLGAGVTSVIPDCNLARPETLDDTLILRQVLAHKVDRITAPPSLCERIANEAKRADVKLGSVRRIFTGGGPVFPGLMQRLQVMAPNADVCALYGSSEAEPMAVIHLSDIRETDLMAMKEGKGLLAGRPVVDIDLAILPDRPNEAIGPYTHQEMTASKLGVEAVGEIVVTGPNVVAGYIDPADEVTTKFLVDGAVWHRTGDCGYLDKEGRLWLVGRCTARVKTRDQCLYPLMVEAAAHAMSDVYRAAYCRVGDDTVLFLEQNREGPSIDEEEVHSRLKWALIDKVRKVRRIPMDRRHASKIDYPALRKQASRSGTARLL